jgi:hypothetical protein
VLGNLLVHLLLLADAAGAVYGVIVITRSVRRSR